MKELSRISMGLHLPIGLGFRGKKMVSRDMGLSNVIKKAILVKETEVKL